MISTKLIAITMVVASLTVIGAVAVMTTTNLNQPVYAQGTQPSGSATNNTAPSNSTAGNTTSGYTVK